MIFISIILALKLSKHFFLFFVELKVISLLLIHRIELALVE